MKDDELLALILVFIPFSFLTIGGGAAVIPGMQHESVVVHQWVTAREFIDLFAISRAAPGPGMMLSTLIGWKVAGWPGAIAATAALFVPAALLFYVLVKLTSTHREKKWHKAFRVGLAPVSTGLIIAGLISLFRLSGGGVFAALVVGSSTAMLLLAPRLPILLVLAFGGIAAWIHATIGF